MERHKTRGFSPWVGKILGGGHGNPLQYSCLENPVDRGARWATVHGAAESDMTEATEHTHIGSGMLKKQKELLKNEKQVRGW